MTFNINKRHHIAIVIFLSLLSAFFVYFPLTNTDVWWHLAAAREMLTKKSILYTDPFAYTIKNPVWIDIHWLFQIVSYAIYNFSGARGLVLIKCLTIVVICALISLAIPEKRYRIFTSVIFTLLVYNARYLVLIRPVLITLLCIAVYIWSFEHFLRSGKKSFLWILLPVQIIWTNSQGLFSLGPVIAGCYLLGEVMQRILNYVKSSSPVKMNIKMVLPINLAVIFVLIVSSCLLNPYGWQGFLFPLKIFERIDPSLVNIYARNISENMPLLELEGDDAHYIYKVVIATIVILLSFLLNVRFMQWSHVLIFGAFLYLAYIAKRNIILYFVVISPIIGYNFSHEFLWERIKRFSGTLSQRICRSVKYAIAAGFLLILLYCTISHANIVKKYPSNSGMSPFRIPIAAVDYLKAHPVKGNMFNSIRHGGYLIWSMYPEKKVFIDGRLIIRSPQFFKEYLAILDNPELFTSVIDQFTITHVILPTAIFCRYMPLVKWLYRSPEWDLVFVDGESVLFVKNEINRYGKLDFRKSGDVKIVRKLIDRNWRNDRFIRDEAYRYFNNLVEYIQL